MPKWCDDYQFPDNVVPIREPLPERGERGHKTIGVVDAPAPTTPRSESSSPQSIVEIADGIFVRLDETERELELAWARLRRTLRG